MSDDLPGFFEKRAILHRASAEECGPLAERLAAAGAPDDALDCLQAAADGDGIARFAARAVESGDPFLLIRIERISGGTLPRDTWDAAIAAAERLGKGTLAGLARRYLEARERS